jgi:demethylmenaquinone methyltransferase/2-methoxy-6-polyprenyl-1,4-benzoquinol methylase
VDEAPFFYSSPVGFGSAEVITDYGVWVADDELSELLSDQVAYYRACAAEYDRGARYAYEVSYPKLVAALERFAPRGRVLELACGTGQWTAELVKHAAHLTALDSSEEMLAINRARVARSDVEYVHADVFAWLPSARYDVVFFSAWLSHVPPQRFDAFWALLDTCLSERGRVFVIDELRAAAALERAIPGAAAPAVERRLASGAQYRAVKVFYEPHALVAQLAALGWRARVEPVGWRFFYATAARHSPSGPRR